MTITDLLAYPEFRGLGWFAVTMCFILLATVTVLVLSHIMFSLGRKSFLYKRRKPIAGWNKRFYPAATLLATVLLVLGLWLRAQL